MYVIQMSIHFPFSYKIRIFCKRVFKLDPIYHRRMFKLVFNVNLQYNMAIVSTQFKSKYSYDAENSTNASQQDAFYCLENALDQYPETDNIGVIISILEGVESRLKRQTDELVQIRRELTDMKVHLDAANDEPLMLLAMKRARAIRKTRKRCGIIELMMCAEDNESNMQVEVALPGIRRMRLSNSMYKKAISICST